MIKHLAGGVGNTGCPQGYTVPESHFIQVLDPSVGHKMVTLTNMAPQTISLPILAPAVNKLHYG